MKILGILNVTPDSFSDGGRYNNVEKAVAQAVQMESEGAEIIDIGAESTRPGADILSPEEEWGRIKDIIPEIRKSLKRQTQISLDSRNASTIKQALNLEGSIDYINDVSGLNDENIINLLVEYNCKAFFMHSVTIPADKNKTIDEDQDIIQFLIDWCLKKRDYLNSKNVDDNQLIFDPGIGFGKTAKQSLDIIKYANILRNSLDLPILIGHSRKSFLKFFGDVSSSNRILGTTSVTSLLANQNIDYIRVHDVKENKLAYQIGEYLSDK
jgi:dihydropteroate synthase